MKKLISAGCLAFALACAASAQFTETESNDTLATANVFANLAPGATITGNSTSNAGAGIDYFQFGTVAAAPGIYRYTMTLSSATPGHLASFRGFGQTPAAAGVWDGSTVGTINTTEASLQSQITSGADRINSWYGFGDANAQMIYRITGTANTVADYVATLTRVSITPMDLGSYSAGNITITTMGQGHTTDTDLWIYDSNFNPIVGYGNDDNSVNGGGTGSGLQSHLTRSFAPGTYYLALSTFALTNEMGSPNDDNFRTGAMMGFPGSILNSDTTGPDNITFNIGGNQFITSHAAGHDVFFGQFTVVPEPATMAVLGLGLLPFLKRRKKS